MSIWSSRLFSDACVYKYEGCTEYIRILVFDLIHTKEPLTWQDKPDQNDWRGDFERFAEFKVEDWTKSQYRVVNWTLRQIQGGKMDFSLLVIKTIIFACRWFFRRIQATMMNGTSLNKSISPWLCFAC
jgi:hypothetical protein